jgi:hypothetical protein
MVPSVTRVCSFSKSPFSIDPSSTTSSVRGPSLTSAPLTAVNRPSPLSRGGRQAVAAPMLEHSVAFIHDTAKYFEQAGSILEMDERDIFAATSTVSITKRGLRRTISPMRPKSVAAI